MVVIAPSSFPKRSAACSGVASNRSLVPRPSQRTLSAALNEKPDRNSLGQLSPSKSMGGFKVWGLAGRLVASSVSSNGG